MGFSLNYGVRVHVCMCIVRVSAAKIFTPLFFLEIFSYVTHLLFYLLFYSKFQSSKNSAANGLSDHHLQFNLTSRPFVELMEFVYEL